MGEAPLNLMRVGTLVSVTGTMASDEKGAPKEKRVVLRFGSDLLHFLNRVQFPVFEQ